jgi:hypothetical protein
MLDGKSAKNRCLLIVSLFANPTPHPYSTISLCSEYAYTPIHHSYCFSDITANIMALAILTLNASAA